MKITNKKNLPQIFVDAATYMAQEKRDFSFSATTLIAPPRQVQLTKRHKDELEEDMVNWWYSFLGNAVHDKLEKGLGDKEDYVCEERIVFEEDHGITVGFKPDIYQKSTKTLYDYKVTSTFIRGLEMKPEWVQQVNLYAYALRRKGVEVNEAHIIIFYKDWREASAKYKSQDEYPQSPVGSFSVPLWTYEQQEKFYYTMLDKQYQAEHLSDTDLPPCEDVWERPAKYAVYRKGADRAIKLCDTMPEAESYIRYKKLTNVGIEFREGTCTRCAQYCEAAPFCSQYKKWLKEQEDKTAQAISYDAPIVSE